MGAAAIAYVIAHHAYPQGQVRTLNGGGYAASNLVVKPAAAHQPWRRGGGQANGLKPRQAADQALLAAVGRNEGAPVADLARAVGLSLSVTSSRLVRLQGRGLAEGPRCCPGRAWALTDQGKAAAMGSVSLLDELDRHVLAVLRSAPMGHVRLSRRIGVCLLTAKRRASLLAERGLVTADVRRFFSITPAGAAALGPDAPQRQPWLRVEAVAASMARDVTARTYVNDMSAAERSRHSASAAKKGRENAKRGKTIGFNGWMEMAS
jgi:Mn-dependent DtxR family transcriptional regulator